MPEDNTPAPSLKNWGSAPYYAQAIRSAKRPWIARGGHGTISERQLLLPLSELTTGLPETIAELEQQALGRLLAEGLEAEKIVIRRRLVSLRHTGQESAEEIEYRDGSI